MCGATSASSANRHRPRASVAGLMMSRTTRFVGQSQHLFASVKASRNAIFTPNPRSSSACALASIALSLTSKAALAASSRAWRSSSKRMANVPSGFAASIVAG